MVLKMKLDTSLLLGTDIDLDQPWHSTSDFIRQRFGLDSTLRDELLRSFDTNSAESFSDAMRRLLALLKSLEYLTEIMTETDRFSFMGYHFKKIFKREIVYVYLVKKWADDGYTSDAEMLMQLTKNVEILCL